MQKKLCFVFLISIPVLNYYYNLNVKVKLLSHNHLTVIKKVFNNCVDLWKYDMIIYQLHLTMIQQM